MLKNKPNNLEIAYWLSDLRYHNIVGGFAMILPVALWAILMWLPLSHAANSWEVEGANGTLHVEGMLTESACRLDMSSGRQEIWLGETGTASLTNPGDRAAPVAFELRLMDCLRTPAGQRDDRSGSLAWAAVQPTVSVGFRAPTDMDSPQLVKAQGVSGLGLRVLDSRGQDVRLGSRGEPLFLSPGQSSLLYTVVPERTRAPLVAGPYLANMDFQLNYD